MLRLSREVKQRARRRRGPLSAAIRTWQIGAPARSLRAVGRTYHVYILTNNSGTLYVGVTNDLERRVGEHRLGIVEGFTKKYRLKRLIYCEETDDVRAALARERQIKKWRRRKKIALVNTINPE